MHTHANVHPHTETHSWMSELLQTTKLPSPHSGLFALWLGRCIYCYWAERFSTVFVGGLSRGASFPLCELLVALSSCLRRGSDVGSIWGTLSGVTGGQVLPSSACGGHSRSFCVHGCWGVSYHRQTHTPPQATPSQPPQGLRLPLYLVPAFSPRSGQGWTLPLSGLDAVLMLEPVRPCFSPARGCCSVSSRFAAGCSPIKCGLERSTLVLQLSHFLSALGVLCLWVIYSDAYSSSSAVPKPQSHLSVGCFTLHI